MKIPGKAFIAPTGLVAATTSVAVAMNQYSSWLDTHPVAKTWLSDNNYTEKENPKDFESKTHHGTFALGCHRVIFEGRNFRRLFEENAASSATSASTEAKSELSDSTSFGSNSEPFVGCSTAYKRKSTDSKNIYEYEVALRQGERGFVERISVYDDKIYSQLIFFEKNNDGKRIKFKTVNKTTVPPYKFVFGLYKYINQNSTSGSGKTYQWGNPEGNSWNDLDLSSTGSSTSTPLYYSIWLEGNGDKGIFDNLGIKSNGKPFSSVAKSSETSNPSINSKFMYFNRKQFTKGAQKSKQGSDTYKPTPEHYDLSVLDSLIDELNKRKGNWKSVESFCTEQKSSLENRAYINEVKKLAQYCYTLKKPQDQKKV